MITLIESLRKLPLESQNKIESQLVKRQFYKGDILVKRNKVENSIYFITKGIARSILYTEDDEITFLFCKEGDLVVSIDSYVERMPSRETVECLEDCEVYELPYDHLFKLFAEDILLANWGRNMAEKALLETEKRLFSRLTKSALQRYEELLVESPGLVNRINLSYIASYLGITQVSLSRIRAQIR